MSHSQFHSIESFILRHAWLNLWDERMTTGRINQVTIICLHADCLCGTDTNGVESWWKRREYKLMNCPEYFVSVCQVNELGCTSHRKQSNDWIWTDDCVSNCHTEHPPSVQSSKSTRTIMSSTTWWRLDQDEPTVRGLIRSNAVFFQVSPKVERLECKQASIDRSVAGWVHYTPSHSVRIQTLRQSFRNHQCIGAEGFSTDPPCFIRSLAWKSNWMGEAKSIVVCRGKQYM